MVKVEVIGKEGAVGINAWIDVQKKQIEVEVLSGMSIFIDFDYQDEIRISEV